MRELIASHGAWALSAMTAFVTVLQGKKVPSAWLVGLVSQAMWLVWIWSTKQWGLLPLTFVLVALYLRNHVLWNEAATGDAEADLRRGWVVGDGSGTKFRCWDSGPAWTTNPYDALYFARRADAESFGEDDEDAWRILFLEYRLTASEVEARRPAARGIEPSEPWPRC